MFELSYQLTKKLEDKRILLKQKLPLRKEEALFQFNKRTKQYRRKEMPQKSKDNNRRKKRIIEYQDQSFKKKFTESSFFYQKQQLYKIRRKKREAICIKKSPNEMQTQSNK